jgi:hypothetical protein
MASNRIVVALALAAAIESCMTANPSATSSVPLHLMCDVPQTTVLLRDVPLGAVVKPAGANYVIAHDVGGIFAFRTVPNGGACTLTCDDDDTFLDPCHMGRWNADGTLLEAETDSAEDLPHLAVHIDGICDQSTIRVDAAPNEVVVDPMERVWVP